MLYGAYRRLVRRLETAPRPRALVLIDFPEFNFRLARAAHRAGLPVVSFIPPQIWAWRAGRVRTIARLVTRVLAVFPFEVPLYRAAGVPVDFVGHPLVDSLRGAPSRAAARGRLRLDTDAVVLGLLPGSRAKEVERLLPALRDAALELTRARPGVRCLVGLAPTVDRARVAGLLRGAPGIEIVEHDARAVMAAADLLLAASGTVTLEAALLGTPMIICYRLSAVSELIARLVLRVPWMRLANLTLGRAVVPELYRHTVTGEGLARDALHLLSCPGAREAQRAPFSELAGALGEPGVGTRAARFVLGQAGAA